MERGGFHGYRKLPDNTSGLKVPEMNMRMGEVNHTNNNHSNSDDNECTVREQDRFMPIANVIRIMRKILPPHAKISDDAKETIQECVSEYISFITGEANEHCQREQRKTITAEDVLWAMSKLGFDDYIEPLTVYLHRYRELEGERGSIRGEPVVKRVVDYGALGVAAFAPANFHVGNHHLHGHGFFGNGTVGGYLKGESNAGSSQAAVANGEPYAQQLKRRVGKKCIVTDSRAFYEFQERRGRAGDPLYVLLCCWLAAVGAGLLKSEEILEGVARLRISNDIEFEEQTFIAMMNEARDRRAKLNAVFVCCFGRDPIEEEDKSLLNIMLRAVFPTVEQSTIQKLIKDKAIKVAEGGDDADIVPELKPLSKEAVQMQMKDPEFLKQNKET
ncbi:Nuclear transcription factor Y subunit B-6 [Hibiscus syriacus]|uniref:Nuclear transcription factor Y subunit B-6 n=2 Tax=Hibiscus syriacus TaxID=106335 RepID=A0A6A2WKG6_HIBSY|nr:Nuclear transcription factor Y subunit B-6 [Hibiscus syriacus]